MYVNKRSSYARYIFHSNEILNNELQSDRMHAQKLRIRKASLQLNNFMLILQQEEDGDGSDFISHIVGYWLVVEMIIPQIPRY